MLPLALTYWPSSLGLSLPIPASARLAFFRHAAGIGAITARIVSRHPAHANLTDHRERDDRLLFTILVAAVLVISLGVVAPRASRPDWGLTIS